MRHLHIGLAGSTIDTEQLAAVSLRRGTDRSGLVLTETTSVEEIAVHHGRAVTVVSGLTVDYLFETRGSVEALVGSAGDTTNVTELAGVSLGTLTVLELVQAIEQVLQIVLLVGRRHAQDAFTAVLAVEATIGHVVTLEFAVFAFVSIRTVTALMGIRCRRHHVRARSSVDTETLRIRDTVTSNDADLGDLVLAR